MRLLSFLEHTRLSAVFESILPVFLLIVFGNLLKRAPVFDKTFWEGLNRLGFYVLYPVLLFVNIVKADFSTLELGRLTISVAVAWTALGLLTLATWPVLKARMSRATYSSVFQSSIRWNGFIALAVAEKLFPPEGVAVVALLMAVIVIPVNIVCVTVIAWFTSSEPDMRATLRKVSTNPLIIGAGLAAIIKMAGIPLPGFAFETLNLLGRAALGMGLVAIGAGLMIKDASLFRAAVAVPTAMKLFVMPLLMVLAALFFGIDGLQLQYLALCAAVPTAMNGYVLAKEMGGDAAAYAASATSMTAISFFSIPAVLLIAKAISAG